MRGRVDAAVESSASRRSSSVDVIVPPHARSQESATRETGTSSRLPTRPQYLKPALFLSRFLPGVRAVVPPLAGAIRVPPTGAIIAIATASTVWYATLALLAYRLGTQWDRVMATIGRFQKGAAIVAGAIVVAGAAIWWLLRRRKRS